MMVLELETQYVMAHPGRQRSMMMMKTAFNDDDDDDEKTTKLNMHDKQALHHLAMES